MQFSMSDKNAAVREDGNKETLGKQVHKHMLKETMRGF